MSVGLDKKAREPLPHGATEGGPRPGPAPAPCGGVAGLGDPGPCIPRAALLRGDVVLSFYGP